MNLIEDLGGYANSKGVLEAYKKNGWSISDVCKGFHQYFTIEDLEKATIQYRREHRIFEVGDYALPNSDHSNEVHFLSDWYIKDLDFRYKTKSGCWGVIVKSCMSTAWRHATDAEIKEGRRL